VHAAAINHTAKKKDLDSDLKLIICYTALFRLNS
jgi:hypothetical protein